MSNVNTDNAIVFVSQNYYAYLLAIFSGGYDYIVNDNLKMDDDGNINCIETGECIIPSADSTYDLGCISTRWSLIQRFLAGGMEINRAAKEAILIYENISCDVILTNRTVNRICEHYANDGDRNLIFGIDHQGELTIYPQTPTQSD